MGANLLAEKIPALAETGQICWRKRRQLSFSQTGADFTSKTQNIKNVKLYECAVHEVDGKVELVLDGAWSYIKGANSSSNFNPILSQYYDNLNDFFCENKIIKVNSFKLSSLIINV